MSGQSPTTQDYIRLLRPAYALGPIMVAQSAAPLLSHGHIVPNVGHLHREAEVSSVACMGMNRKLFILIFVGT